MNMISDTRLMAREDAFDRLREQRKMHMASARVCRGRAQSATDHRDKAFWVQCFMAQARTHRLCSRYLWKNGAN